MNNYTDKLVHDLVFAARNSLSIHNALGETYIGDMLTAVIDEYERQNARLVHEVWYAKEKAKILEALETSRVDKPDPFPESLATNLSYPIKVKSYD